MEAKPDHPLLAVLRWGAVLPAAVLAVALAGSAAYLASYLGSALAGFGLVRDDPRHFVLAAGFSAFAGVYSASRVAPAYRPNVALFIGVAGSLVALLSLVVNLQGVSWVPALQNVAVLVGSFLGVRYVRDNE